MNNKLQSGIILKLVFIIPFIFAPLRYALYSLHFKNSYNLNERDELTAIAGGTQHESLYRRDYRLGQSCHGPPNGNPAHG